MKTGPNKSAMATDVYPGGGLNAALDQSRHETPPHLVRHGLIFAMWLLLFTIVFTGPGAWIEDRLGIEGLGLISPLLAFYIAAYTAASGYLSKFPATIDFARSRLARLYAAVGVAIWSLIGVGVVVVAVVARASIELTDSLPFVLLLIGVLPVYWIVAKAAIRLSETQAELTATSALARLR